MLNKNNDVTLTIIIVHLNDIINLIKTLDSIIVKEKNNVEIIIIDGKTKNIKKELYSTLNRNKDIILLSEKDSGIYDAMNKGIQKAKNEFTLFLNSGDTFSSKESLSDLLIEIKNKKLLDNNQSDIFIWKVSVDQLLNKIKYGIFNKNTVHSVFSHQGVIVKTSILKKYMFNLSYKLAADYDLFKKLFYRNYKFKYLKKVYTNVTSDGVSDSKRLNVLFEWYKINTHYGFTFITYLKFLFVSLKVLISIQKKWLTRSL